MQKIIKLMMVLITTGILLVSPFLEGQSCAADGDGDGSGGGQNNPLVIESSTPANGATGVTELEYIKIVFSKNVVYMTVREKNMQGFSFWSGNQKLPAQIIMADDQIEREKRNDVLVKPLQPLLAGETYRIEIAPEVQSKSGVALGNKATITFTMAGGSKDTATAGKDQPVAALDNQISDQSSTKITEPVDTAASTADGNENGTTAPAANSEQNTAGPAVSYSSNALLWIALGAAAVTLIAVGYSRMGRSK